MVMVKGEEHFGLPRGTIGMNNCAEGVVTQDFRVGAIDMRITHMFKHCQALVMFGDSMMEDVLLHGWNLVRENRDQFHHQVAGAFDGCAAESFVHKIS